MNKLYIVVRSDLAPGLMLAQACHTAFKFSVEYPEITNQWINVSNYIAILSVENERQLLRLLKKAQQFGILTSSFQEPDINNTYTGIALEPNKKSKKLCKTLKLALNDN